MLIKKLLQSDGTSASRTEKVLALTIAGTVNTALSLISGMAASRLLTKTEVAINSQTFLAYDTFAPFLTLGITSSIYYYLSQNEERKRGVLKEAVLLTLAASTLACLFLLLGGNQFLAEHFHNEAISKTLLFLIPYALLTVPASVMACVFVAENRLRFNAFFSTFQVSVQLVVVLLTIFFFRTGTATVAAKSLTGCVFAIITIALAFSILPKGGGQCQWNSTKALLALSLPLGLSTIVGSLDRHLDQWIISTMLTPEAFAVYTRGAQELPLIGTITGSINTVMIVDLTKAVKEKEYSTAVSLFRRISEKSSLLLMPIMVFFMAAAKPLISFLYTDAYLDTVSVFQIYLLYLPIRLTVYSPFLIALGHSRFILYKTTAELLLNVGVSVLLVTLLGAEGAALGTILLLYVFNVPLNLHIISKDTGVSWKKLLPFRSILLYILWSLPGAAAFRIVEILLPLPSFWTLVLDFVIFCGVSGPIFIYALHLSPRALFRQCYGIIRSLFSNGHK